MLKQTRAKRTGKKSRKSRSLASKTKYRAKQSKDKCYPTYWKRRLTSELRHLSTHTSASVLKEKRKDLISDVVTEKLLFYCSCITPRGTRADLIYLLYFRWKNGLRISNGFLYLFPPPTSFKSGFIWNKYQLAQYQPLNSYSLQDHFPCYHVNEPPWSSPALLYIMVVLLLNTVKAVQASITTHRWIKYTVHLVKQWLLKVYSPPYLYTFRFEVLWRRM